MPDPTTMLKQDHRTVKKMLQELGETEAGTARRRLLDEVGAELALHMQIEEQLLYPLLAEADPEKGQGAEIEHGLAREGLDTLRELQDTPGFGAAVDMLLAGLQHHIREEETEIFPLLKGEMERSVWMDLGTQIEEMKRRGTTPAHKQRMKGAATSTRTGRRSGG